MISTPDHWHVPIALAAIKAGKDVDLREADRSGHRSRESPGRCGGQGQDCLSHRQQLPLRAELFRAVSLVRTGKIGQLKTIRMSVPIYPVPTPNEAPMPVPEELDYELWRGPPSGSRIPRIEFIRERSLAGPAGTATACIATA